MKSLFVDGAWLSAEEGSSLRFPQLELICQSYDVNSVGFHLVNQYMTIASHFLALLFLN